MCFLTGSRVYGRPKVDSDIDMVVRMDWDEAEDLRRQSDTRKREPDSDFERVHYHEDEGTVCLRFGKLNLIVCLDDRTYDVWQKMTSRCSNEAPVTRDKAIEYRKMYQQLSLKGRLT